MLGTIIVVKVLMALVLVGVAYLAFIVWGPGKDDDDYWNGDGNGQFI